MSSSSCSVPNPNPNPNQVSITWEFFDEYLNTARTDDWRPVFGVPYERNTLVILAIGPHMHILLVQAR